MTTLLSRLICGHPYTYERGGGRLHDRPVALEHQPRAAPRYSASSSGTGLGRADSRRAARFARYGPPMDDAEAPIWDPSFREIGLVALQAAVLTRRIFTPPARRGDLVPEQRQMLMAL